MKRYSIYLMDLETFNVYDDPAYTDDLEEAKQIAINMVKHAKFDHNYDFVDNAFIVSIDDNKYQMTYDWQILSYGVLPYEEVKNIAGQDFNGYTQIDNSGLEQRIYESVMTGIQNAFNMQTI